jgi:hypothetical protein
MSPEAVREALGVVADGGAAITVEDLRALRVVVAAARDWLRIQEEAETIWWCEKHGSRRNGVVCDLIAPYPEATKLIMEPCVMVERRLVVPLGDNE